MRKGRSQGGQRRGPAQEKSGERTEEKSAGERRGTKRIRRLKEEGGGRGKDSGRIGKKKRKAQKGRRSNFILLQSNPSLPQPRNRLHGRIR
jgi:hypothetical protein